MSIDRCPFPVQSVFVLVSEVQLTVVENILNRLYRLYSISALDI